MNPLFQVAPVSRAPLWGTCQSLIAAVALPKQEVNRLLPAAVALHEQQLTAPGEHPVIFMFNTQKIHIFFPWFVIHYHEMIPLIPLVHFKHAPDKTYQMSPILYVSSRRIVWGAQTLWNLNKIFARFRSKPAIRELPRLEYLEQSVFRAGNKDISISARTESKAAAPEAFPHFQVLNPLLNDDALIDAPNEQYFTATYRIQPHTVQAIEATIDVFNLPGMEPGSYCVKSISHNPLGAFKLDFSWQLHFPQRAKV